MPVPDFAVQSQGFWLSLGPWPTFASRWLALPTEDLQIVTPFLTQTEDGSLPFAVVHTKLCGSLTIFDPRRRGPESWACFLLHHPGLICPLMGPPHGLQGSKAASAAVFTVSWSLLSPTSLIVSKLHSISVSLVQASSIFHFERPSVGASSDFQHPPKKYRCRVRKQPQLVSLSPSGHHPTSASRGR